MKWIRAFFEEVLGWQHGTEFVFIASMNTMAALIGGKTIHSFGHILVDANQRQAKKGTSWAAPDINKMWDENQNLRWVLMDEGSTASAEIFNILESNVRASTREQNAGVSYKVRPDGVERPFGGINLGVFGDWWQLPPVQQTPLFTNPYRKHDHGVQRSLAMFWSRGEDSLTQVRELTREQRCKDPWLSTFLKGCRDGRQSWSMYNFVHGYSTYEVGSYMEDTKQPSCGNARCVELMDDLWPSMKRQGI